MEEILGVKGDGCGWDRNIFIQCATVADIGPHGERHRFGLWDGITGSKFSSFRFNAGRILPQIVPAAWRDNWATLALSSWMVACCSLSCRLCPGPWLWLGLWLWTWACTSRSSSRETSESDGLLVYESAEPYKHITTQTHRYSPIDTNMENLLMTLLCYEFCSTFKGKQDNSWEKKISYSYGFSLFNALCRWMTKHTNKRDCPKMRNERFFKFKKCERFILLS